MLNKPSTISVIFILFFVCLSSFSGLRTSKKTTIKGTWYYMANGTYSSTNTRGSKRWYTIKNHRISYSSCTDWCGCMRKTYYGRYTRLNDSIISITYNKVRSKGMKIAERLKEKQVETLKIIKINSSTLKIVDVH